MADDSLEPSQSAQPQLDAPAQLGVSVLGMTGDPSTMAHHAGIGPFVDNSQWNKPASEVGIHEKDIQDYVGKAKDYYDSKLRDGFPELPDERRKSLLDNFSSSLTNHVREYAIEKYAQGVNQAQATGDSTYIRAANIASMVPFVGTATDYAESSRREQAQKKIAGGEGEPYDFFTEGLNRARDRTYANMPWYGKMASGTGHLAKFGLELEAGKAAGIPGLGEAPAGTGLLQSGLRAGAGMTALQAPGIAAGAFMGGADPVETAEHLGKEFVNNTAFAGLAGIGKAREGVKGAFIGALKLMAAGEGAQDLTSGFGYLGQPGSLLRTLQAKTPEERSQALSDFFTSNAGPALLFEGAKHAIMNGGTAKTAIKQALNQESVAQSNTTPGGSFEPPATAFTPGVWEEALRQTQARRPKTAPAGSAINAPQAPIPPEEEPKPTQEAVDTSTGIQSGLGAAGQAIGDNLYRGMFDALKAGKSTFAGVKDPQMERARPAFERGEINSPEQLRDFLSQSPAAQAGLIKYGEEGGPDWTLHPAQKPDPESMSEPELHDHAINNTPEVNDAINTLAQSSGRQPEAIRRALLRALQEDSANVRASASKSGAGLQGNTGGAEAEAAGAVPEAAGDELKPGEAGGPGAMGVGPQTELGKFANTVLDAAYKSKPEDRFFDNKVFISSLWRAVKGQMPDMSLNDFKTKLIQANQAHLLNLSRADLVQAMDPARVKASEAVIGDPEHPQASFHFVTIDPRSGTGGMGAMGAGPQPGRPGAQKVSAAGDVGAQEDHAPLADTMSVSRWQNFKDFWNKLAGGTAPRMTRASTASSEKLAQLAAVNDYLRERLPNLIDQVIGKDATDEEAKVIGTTFQEMRHRAARTNLMNEAHKLNQQADWNPDKEEAAALRAKAKDLIDWANGISTFVGGDGSPLDSEETYQRYANSPKMKDFLQRWQQLVVPEMDKNTRSARGLEDSDPIDSLTQMPGFPMHAKAVTEDSQPLSSVGARRGNLQGMKLRRDPYQNRATLASDRYDTDIRSIMEESLRKTTRNARLAEFYRTAESEGIGQWAPGNARFEGYKMVPNTRPPSGTQTAEPGDQFWIRGDLYDETHQAMGLDRPFAKLPFTNSATWWALQSTAEATYHAKNLLTGMFKPGMNPGDLFKNAYSVLTKDPWMQERMVELARIGAGTTKQSTFNPKNPMTYMGKMIDVMDRSVRLTAEDAFNKMLRTGSTGKLAEALGVKVNLDGSEASKRDFVNQVAGNYNKLTQSRMVAWARDVGIGPFATAGTTYWANGVRGLVGESGLKATDTASDLKLRATMLAKPLAILGAVMAYNYARWGRVDGDEGTPFGSMKLDTRNGKTVSWNPLVFTGLPRGIRSIGAMPALERGIHGQSVGENEVGKGLTNIGGSALHPFVGPAGNFVTEGMTGHSIFGTKTAPDARKGQSQSWLNWKSALLNSNPILANVTGADNPYKDKSDWVEKGWKLLGPFGPQFRKPARR